MQNPHESASFFTSQIYLLQHPEILIHVERVKSSDIERTRAIFSTIQIRYT